MSVCGCNSSSPVSHFLDFAEQTAEKIGDGLLNAGFGAVEQGIDTAEHALQFAEHAGEHLAQQGERALMWAEHMGRPLVEIGCEVAQKFEQLGAHLGNTLREDCQHLGAKAAPLLNEIGQIYGRMQAQRAAENERAREGIREGLAQLIAGAIDGRLWEDTSCSDAPYHVDPSNGQFTQAGDAYGVG